MLKFGTRDEYHKKKGKHVYGKDDCPFCKIEDQKSHIVWEGKYWYVLHNLYPYSGNEKHIMAVPYTHKKFFLDLTNDEILGLKDVHLFIKDFYGDDNYFSCLRETMANRSIEHLHMHFIPGVLKGRYLRKMLMDQGFPIVEKID